MSQPWFPMKLTTDAQVALAESHAQKAMEAKAASEVSAACLILRFFRDEHGNELVQWTNFRAFRVLRSFE